MCPDFFQPQSRSLFQKRAKNLKIPSLLSSLSRKLNYFFSPNFCFSRLLWFHFKSLSSLEYPVGFESFTRQAGVNFINVFMCCFYTCRSQQHKKLLDLTVFFALLGSEGVIAPHKMMMKLTTEAAALSF